jgi:hypothetical protein
MDDTPPEIKQLQLDIWLSKTPMERLRTALIDNDAFFSLVNELKKNMPQNINDNTAKRQSED